MGRARREAERRNTMMTIDEEKRCESRSDSAAGGTQVYMQIRAAAFQVSRLGHGPACQARQHGVVYLVTEMTSQMITQVQVKWSKADKRHF